jgi:hypothetical protein
LNVRELPDWKSAKAGTIPYNGRYVLFRGKKAKVGKHDWYEVEYYGDKSMRTLIVKGWVNSRYLVYSGNAEVNTKVKKKSEVQDIGESFY